MNRLSVVFATPLLISFSAGCTAETSGDDVDLDDELAAEAEESFLAPNSLAPNSLAPNSLAPNSLAPNSLAPNSLAPNSLAPNSLAPNSLAPNALATILAPTPEGAAARAVLRYTVSCALKDTQSFAFNWSDATGVVHDEVYSGSIGLAPGWATAPLTGETEQRLVSSCLAARVNWYGVTVVISMRSAKNPLKSETTAEELAAYPHIEGAFWGNLFTQSPYLNACYNDANVDVSRAASRDCATGHLDGGKTLQCGIVTLTGSCSNVCDPVSSEGHYYPSCKDRPGSASTSRTSAVITTALP